MVYIIHSNSRSSWEFLDHWSRDLLICRKGLMRVPICFTGWWYESKERKLTNILCCLASDLYTQNNYYHPQSVDPFLHSHQPHMSECDFSRQLCHRMCEKAQSTCKVFINLTLDIAGNSVMLSTCIDSLIDRLFPITLISPGDELFGVVWHISGLRPFPLLNIWSHSNKEISISSQRRYKTTLGWIAWNFLISYVEG